MYIFHTPVRKKDAFVSRIQPAGPGPAGSVGTGGGSVVLSFKECRILSVRPLAGADAGAAGAGGAAGYLVKLQLNTQDGGAAYEALKVLDVAARAAVSANNGKWFKNNLTEAAIHEYFRSSAEESNGHFTVLVSGLLPVEVTVDGKEEEAEEGRGGIHRLMTMESRQLKGMLAVRAEVESQGLYFYPKRFGIRWRLRRLECLTEEAQQEATRSVARMFSLSAEDRANIEADWEREASEFCAKVDGQIATLEKRKGRVRELLAAARALPLPDREWNTALETLRASFYLPLL